ncbi:MarR family winged helix-turn-helix transcriptional regulator [Streptomyces sp. NPDC015171]|uniref:MarR family winged helix-turn-helix transcriptional regulator n=1 Tax=Streptomyces sp. NPDC015171 TaxID=3364945 RepID=UPI003702DC77
MEADTFPEELADSLVRIQRLIRRRLRGGLTGPRLRGAEIELLRLVESRPGIGISDAARQLHLASNSVSTLVNQLVRDGHLARETDPADRRAARLLLTETAERRLRDWRRRRTELMGRQVSGLGEADQEALRAALPALHRLAVMLHEETEETEEAEGPEGSGPARAPGTSGET